MCTDGQFEFDEVESLQKKANDWKWKEGELSDGGRNATSSQPLKLRKSKTMTH